MKLTPLRVTDTYLVENEPARDDRGWFARIYSADLFAQQGLDTTVAQCSFSFNDAKYTLRGMHVQAAPHGESKLVVCTSGAIYDVVLDLRRDSPTYLQWDAAELRAGDLKAVWVSPGIAHGFLTLEADSTVYYQISTPYEPGSARGYRFDDPTFSINWPHVPLVISARDANYALIEG